MKEMREKDLMRMVDMRMNLRLVELLSMQRMELMTDTVVIIMQR